MEVEVAAELTSQQTRAEQLLDKLDDCTLSGGLTEDDLIGTAVREPLRTAAAALAAQLYYVSAAVPPQDARALQSAVARLQRCAASEADAGAGRLDVALTKLVEALDPSAAAATSSTGGGGGGGGCGGNQRRLCALERLVHYLQAARLLALRSVPATSGTQPASAGGAAPGPSAGAQPEPAGAAGHGSIGGGGGGALTAADGGGGAPTAADGGGAACAVSNELRSLARALGVDGGAATAAPVVTECIERVAALRAAAPEGFFAPLLPRSALSEAQLSKLQAIDAELRADYVYRRSMLTKRAEVTLQSMLWSSRLSDPHAAQQAAAAAERVHAGLAQQSYVQLEDVFAAHAGDLLAVMPRAGGRRGGPLASVKSVLIGAVPDRGGRSDAGMPEWAERKPDAGGRSGGRAGGRAGGRGGGKKRQRESGSELNKSGTG